MQKKQGNIPIYLIEWMDASGDSGWKDITQTIPLAQVFSVGVLVDESEDCYTLTQSISADSHSTIIDNTVVIPKVGINKVTQLTTVEGCKCQKAKKKKPQKKTRSQRKS
jgi:hypothetical protein